MEEFTKLIIKWHHDRNLIDGSSDKDQVLKLAQELGELSDSVCKGKDVKDDLGDMMVVMLNIMARQGVSMEELTKLIIKWHHDRNLIDGSSDKDQVLKLAQELGELSDSVCKGKDVKDDLGDMMVVMLNIMERQGVSMEDCLKTAYNDIKDRKGMMVDGIFVKEGDS